MSSKQPLHNPEDNASGSEEMEENLHMRLRIVEHLLSTAPMLAPKTDFAERVIEVIRQHQAQTLNRNASTGLILGLSIVVLMSLSLVLAAIFGIINIVLRWTDIYQGLVMAGGEVNLFLDDLISALRTTITDTPQIPALTLLSIPLFFVWLTVMRRLIPMEQTA